ncbi:hypothetical protein [Nocardioides solisilvae]|uniref:hypothetical protein n=1 Tax=Nocardioides solisilvae TaxID=1542435 RepID=UPI0013A59DF3|nr:hypothetical protein [Nocardioides solisilvae]
MPAVGMHARMDALRHLRGDSWFASTVDVEGADDETGLTLTVDATGWVVDVQVPEGGLGVSDAQGLELAVRRALDAAAAMHLLENSRLRTLSAMGRQRAADLLAGRTTLTPPRVEPSPPVEIPTHPVAPSGYATDERWGRRWTGVSRENEVRVTMSLLRGLEELAVDHAFLASADTTLLRHALREAFADAARRSDTDQEVTFR